MGRGGGGMSSAKVVRFGKTRFTSNPQTGKSHTRAAAEYGCQRSADNNEQTSKAPFHVKYAQLR